MLKYWFKGGFNTFQPPGSDPPAFLPPGIGISQAILMEVFYSLTRRHPLCRVHDRACRRGELTAHTSTLPTAKPQVGNHPPHPLRLKHTAAHRTNCTTDSEAQNTNKFSLQKYQRQKSMVMLEGFLSPALLKSLWQQPRHRAARRRAAQSSPATS